ncbi:cyanoexosortase C [Leptothoe sp. LEGE 181152]|nr:cyanoexosortase C [Leptothoe sp. LEGE 181152]
MNWQTPKIDANGLLHVGRTLLQQGLRNTHNRLVMAGLFVGIVFLPFWLQDIIVGTIHGAASLLLVSALGLGLYQLWLQRSHLAKLKASSEDRWLGHLIILVGLGAAPFCAAAEWSQKLIWVMILCGIAISSWGFAFFPKYSASVFLIAVGLFPQPTAVGKAVWNTFTPPEILERFMAWCGGISLNLIGQAATVNWTDISLPGGTARVDWGCSGYDLACIAAVTSLLMGLFFKQSFWKTSLIILVGIVLALIANVPRIMLMTMANAYWGEESFAFWHGFWGGQIFLSILFTVHYYAVMAIVKQKPTKKVA